MEITREEFKKLKIGDTVNVTKVEAGCFTAGYPYVVMKITQDSIGVICDEYRREGKSGDSWLHDVSMPFLSSIIHFEPITQEEIANAASLPDSSELENFFRM